MKSKDFRKKLSLNKKTVAHLNQGTMKGVLGGNQDYSEVVLKCLDPGLTAGDTGTFYCSDSCYPC